MAGSTDPRNRRAGVRDVARLAGVSSQTVSRTLNGYPGIRDETRRRVLDAVEALGYRMNNAARALGTRTTRTIGVLASDPTLFGPSVGIAALETAARERDHWIATAYADAGDADTVVDAMDRLLAQGVDGLVVLAPHLRSLHALTSRTPGVPLAVLHGGEGEARQAEGAGLAIDHLVAGGHRRIGRISGPADWLEARARDDGFAEALARAGVIADARWWGNWSAASGAALATEVAESVRVAGGPTAIAVANDQMALGLIAGLARENLAVPGDVSVTGFDDNPDAAFYRPGLTSVRLDLAGEARRVVGEILGLDGGTPASPALVERASTRSLEQ